MGGQVHIETGKSYRLNLGKGNPNNQVFHVRAIVDDEWVVVRTWSKRHGWRYRIEYMGVLMNWAEQGFITPVGAAKDAQGGLL